MKEFLFGAMLVGFQFFGIIAITRVRGVDFMSLLMLGLGLYELLWPIVAASLQNRRSPSPIHINY